jgi:hypothetical protein
VDLGLLGQTSDPSAGIIETSVPPLLCNHRSVAFPFLYFLFVVILGLELRASCVLDSALLLESVLGIFKVGFS